MSGEKERDYTEEEARQILDKARELFVHVAPKCDHDFQGWREFADGNGGETVCTKCGMGAMQWSLRTGL